MKEGIFLSSEFGFVLASELLTPKLISVLDVFRVRQAVKIGQREMGKADAVFNRCRITLISLEDGLIPLVVIFSNIPGVENAYCSCAGRGNGNGANVSASLLGLLDLPFWSRVESWMDGRDPLDWNFRAKPQANGRALLVLQYRISRRIRSTYVGPKYLEVG